MNRGLFIAIEGGDGSGKTTQADLLEQRLSQTGEVFRIKFPQYGGVSSKLVEAYLNGQFGELGTVIPELVSLAYAIDRFAAAKTIRAKLDAGITVMADRYVASNLAHQAAGIDSREKRETFYELIKQIEYGVLELPRPDLNIVLLVPIGIAVAHMDSRAARSYTAKKRDLHEANHEHLEHAKRNYEELCRLYPEEFVGVACMKNNSLLPIAAIHQSIWEIIEEKRTHR